MDTITVSKKKIAEMVTESGKVLFKSEAEAELLKLLKLKDEIDTAVESVKENILKAGHSITKDFTGVIGERVRCVVRKYGDKYLVGSGTNHSFIKETVIRRADSKQIEAFREKSGKLPKGIIEAKRAEKLAIIVPNVDHTTIRQIDA